MDFGAKMDAKMNQKSYKYRFFEKVKNSKKQCNRSIIEGRPPQKPYFSDPKTFKKQVKKNNTHKYNFFLDLWSTWDPFWEVFWS